MTPKSLLPYFLLSMLGHLVFCFTISWALPPTSQPINSAKSVSAYIYQPTVLQALHRSDLSKNLTSKLGLKKRLFKNKKRVENKVLKKSSQHSLNSKNQSYIPENNIAKPLLKLLHDATMEHLHYPIIAMELRKTGVVTIGFLISPLGFISHVVLLKSSGFDPLDNAALQAVRSISPVSNIQQYIATSKFLSVDVVFQ